MDVVYFLSQTKRKNGTFEKGLVVHQTADAARQGFHAYLSAYGYGHEQGTDYCYAAVNDSNGAVVEAPVMWKAAEPEPEPNAE